VDLKVWRVVMSAMNREIARDIRDRAKLVRWNLPARDFNAHHKVAIFRALLVNPIHLKRSMSSSEMDAKPLIE
jgi:hypothetical protein